MFAAQEGRTTGRHPFWHLSLQNSEVVPQKPNSLQQTFRGHDCFPWGANCPHSAVALQLPWHLGVMVNIVDGWVGKGLVTHHHRIPVRSHSFQIYYNSQTCT